MISRYLPYKIYNFKFPSDSLLYITQLHYVVIKWKNLNYLRFRVCNNIQGDVSKLIGRYASFYVLQKTNDSNKYFT